MYDCCALVQSRVDYANSLYTGMSYVNFDKLQLVQNTLARVVTLTRKWDHIQPSLKRLHWLPIRQRVDFKVALLTYSIRYSGEPKHLNSPLMDSKPTRSLPSAEEHLLVVPWTKLSSISWAFSVVARKLWNNLPLDIRNAKTMSIFSKMLKTYLYKQAYEH